MGIRRQLQVNSLLQQELAAYWEREVELPQGVMLSVARVDVAPSFDSATVYVSIWPERYETQVMELLRAQVFATQKYIDKRLYMKKVPKLIIESDAQSAARREVEDLLDSL